jgi:hypothetical protein
MMQANGRGSLATLKTAEYGRIEVIPRKEFLRDWDYSSGHHLTMLGPTQRGKTTLGFELLQRSISEARKATVYAGKPPGRDPTMARAADMLNLRIIESWPPPMRAIEDRRKKNNGYVLRPHQTMTDLDADEANIEKQFRAGLRGNFASSLDNIAFADEGYLIEVDLGLKKECDAIHMRGAPVVGLWLLLQRGRFVSYQAYSAPEHVFIGYDPDEDNRKRYSDIGGVDPGFVRRVTATLKTETINKGKKGGGNTISEFLYMRRAGPQLCIVDMH